MVKGFVEHKVQCGLFGNVYVDLFYLFKIMDSKTGWFVFFKKIIECFDVTNIWINNFNRLQQFKQRIKILFIYFLTKNL